MSRIHMTVKAIVLYSAITLVLFLTLFVSYSGFIEAQILPKWYGFIAGTVLLTGFWFVLFSRRIEISLDSITIATSIFLGYLLLRIAVIGAPAIGILALVSFILLYFIFRVISPNEMEYFGIVVVCLCVIQAVYGIEQCFGIFNSPMAFDVVGSFDNPAGYAACLATGFPFCFSLFKKTKILKYMGVISLIVIAAGIVISGSRAGVLAIAMASGIYPLAKFYKPTRSIHKYIIVFVVSIFLLAVPLVFLKKNSAIGRLAIWQNSIEMIADKPVLGHGPGAFMADYMLYQADYFAAHPESIYAQLANNVTHPFNEYLLLAAEYGLLGLLVLLILFISVICTQKRLTLPLLCLVAIAILGCFSYPLRYPFIWVLSAYSLANLQTDEKSRNLRTGINNWGKAAFFLLLGCIAVFLVRDIRFEARWGKLALKGRFMKYEQYMEHYENLYSEWNGDPLFLYNYGAVLNQAGDYTQSSVIMAECEKYQNDYDVQMILGDNYSGLKQFREAEHHYLLAHNMIPNRFLPLFGLMQLYEANGENRKVLETARKIVTKKIKIPSQTVDQIIRKAEKFIGGESQ